MKNNPFKGLCTLFNHYNKLFIIMRLSLFLSMALTLKLFSATTYSQQTKLSLDLENTTVKELLKEIGKTTEFSFWYSNDILDDNYKVTLSMKDVTIDKVLDLALKDQDLTYDIMDKVILIYKSDNRDKLSKYQQIIITGVVKDAATNEPLPGVNILIEGTQNGTITKTNGEYQLEVPDNNTLLIFSSIGYISEKISVDGRSLIDVSLSPDVVALKEVVVTALGISREKKTLTYATRQVGGDELSNSREINISSALQGKVAGININSTNSGPGGSSRLVLRGDKSIKGNNQPLIVLDGVPIDNTSNAMAETSYGTRDNGDGLSNINSDDIESLTVLPGPAASALYGSAASNGVIIINTKKGTGTKQGLGVQVSSSLLFSNPMIYPKFQNVYGQGTGGAFQSSSEYSWGPKMTGQMVTDWTGKSQALIAQPDNFKDFFRTGTELMNTLAITSGHTYFSYTNTSSKGIIPNNKYRRNNFNLRETFELTKGLTLDTKVTYMLEDDINRQSTGMRNYAVSSLYQMPRSIRLSDVKNFESIVNNERVQNYWNPGSFSLQNPYWTVNRNLYERTRRRFLGMVLLRYQFTQALSAQIRGSGDYYNDFTEEKDYNNSYWVETPGQGNYIVEKKSNRLLTADALITYAKDISSSINLNINAGASIERNDFETSILNNRGLVEPNVFSSANAVGLATFIYNPEQMMSRSEKHSLYGAATIGIKNFMFLNLTGRNDWNSTLPPDNLSYFYPSFGANLIVSELLNLPKVISFLKLRGTYAIVASGTGFDNYRLTRYDFRSGGNSIFMFSDGTLYLKDLKPETTRSWEGGVELNMWKNRLGLDLAVYKSNTDNQILSIPMSSSGGYLNRIINAGEIENKGVEVTLDGKPLILNNFSWDIGITFSRNENKIKKLSLENQNLILTWDRMANMTAYVGGKYSDLWVTDFQRNANGQIIVNNAGIPLITDKEYYAGNPNPDWRAGILNTFRYKNLSLSALIDIRQGGVILSHTQALLSAMGCSENTLANREADFIIPNSVLEDGTTPNTTAISAETYWKLVGGGDPVGRLFICDASNIRLREVSLSYTLPESLTTKGFIKEATISLIGRNLFFISNKAEVVDPEAAAVGTGSAQGIEYCSNPSLRSYGFQLRLNF
jgi:TonB-linked SusC/RagA family outer membrane protein